MPSSIVSRRTLTSARRYAETVRSLSCEPLPLPTLPPRLSPPTLDLPLLLGLLVILLLLVLSPVESAPPALPSRDDSGQDVRMEVLVLLGVIEVLRRSACSACSNASWLMINVKFPKIQVAGRTNIGDIKLNKRYVPEINRFFTGADESGQYIFSPRAPRCQQRQIRTLTVVSCVQSLQMTSPKSPLAILHGAAWRGPRKNFDLSR